MYYQREFPFIAVRACYNTTAVARRDWTKTWVFQGKPTVGQPVHPCITAKKIEPFGGLAVRDL